MFLDTTLLEELDADEKLRHPLAAILTALGTTFSIILGLNTDSAIIISALVAIVYTGIGGLK
ncbi:MAG: hypothetical protein MJK14_21925, partial [Rivularia sp. ALOHA_DT_140]|nr:hypothetical protein [Rivularia sp. ALOHA_DT_140]